ncbi:MAG: NAD+ synthase [Nitrososphaera sp.]
MTRISSGAAVLDSLLRQDYSRIASSLAGFVKRYIASSNSGGVVVGLSGGLDSSAVATICVRAIGADRVYGLIMPAAATPEQDINDAAGLARSLGIRYDTPRLEDIVSEFQSALPGSSDNKPLGNLTSRIRMSVLYYYAAVNKMLVAGTTDKSELLIGYFTKYGDGAADIEPIASLYKSQVRALGKFLKVPDEILQKKSSPRLWQNQLAEEEIGIDYETIDSVLYLLVDKKMDKNKISRKLGIDSNTIDKITGMVLSSAHKRKTPPFPRLRA